MEYECSPFSWEICYQEEGLEELRHSLLYTTLELEATIASAKEEITTRECELSRVNELLSIAIKERDEAQAKCQKLMLEKLELQQELQHQQQQQQLVQTQQQQQHNEDDFQGDISEKHHSPTPSSDYEENSMPLSSPGGVSTSSHPTPFEVTLELALKRPLPEKGKLLKAVVEAGPLLQTILLAGPLPQWQQPPPQLKSIEIPPVAISSPATSSLVLPLDSCKKSFSFSKKRELVPSDGAAADECPVSKCRKVIQQSPTTPNTTTSHHSLPSHPSFS